MPSINLADLKRPTPSWSLINRAAAILTPRDGPPSFHAPHTNPHPHHRSGLHPAIIFGIVAGVMLIVIITAWVCWFRLIKKLFFARKYGAVPSGGIAAGNYAGYDNGGYKRTSSVRGDGDSAYEPYTHQGTAGGAGNLNREAPAGGETTQYPPLALNLQAPPVYESGGYAGGLGPKESGSLGYGGAGNYDDRTGPISVTGPGTPPRNQTGPVI